MNCVICGIRKPRRHCPGVHGDICSICCGTEREQSVDCPLECTYLHDAHEHEKSPEFDGATLPNRDIEITEEFLHSNEVLMAFLAVTLFEGALKAPGVTDWDVREALEALVKTYRTLKAGLYYETAPTNPFAAGIAAHVQATLAEIKQKEVESGHAPSIRDAAVLGIFAFLQRLEYSHNNGRKRSRAFLDFLSGFYIPSEDAQEARVLEPDAPRIIL
ncbi:MAG TPA: hypothetical protein VHY84_28205 [Bryobacteraceae bacterium]|nr:hypothetical protein [Bryobacteraceae bacterium]